MCILIKVSSVRPLYRGQVEPGGAPTGYAVIGEVIEGELEKIGDFCPDLDQVQCKVWIDAQPVGQIGLSFTAISSSSLEGSLYLVTSDVLPTSAAELAEKGRLSLKVMSEQITTK